MMGIKHYLIGIFYSFFFMVSVAISQLAVAQPESDISCQGGYYTLSDGRDVIIIPFAEDGFRYIIYENGNRGHVFPGEDGVYRPKDGSLVTAIEFKSCSALTWSESSGQSFSGVKNQFDIRMTDFENKGATFHGKFVLPLEKETFPLVLFVHGSEGFAATKYYYWQYLLPAQGIGVFIFDKRGTGESGGEYTQDFYLLAGDAVAAAELVKNELGPLISKFGILGGSQGGWILSIAATKFDFDFAIANYSLAHSPLIEDREEVLQGLRSDGYGEDILTLAIKVTDATGRGMVSGFNEGLEDIKSLKEQYDNEDWFKAIKGEFTGDVMSAPTEQLPEIFKQIDVGTTWDYDPVPNVRKLNIPYLWVLAEMDTEAPSILTFSILRDLQNEKPNIEIAVNANADHSMRRVTWENGERQLSGYVPGYFQIIVDWIKTENLETEAANWTFYPDTGE